MPLLGALSDRLGRRTVIVACLAGFAAGSAITAGVRRVDHLAGRRPRAAGPGRRRAAAGDDGARRRPVVGSGVTAPPPWAPWAPRRNWAACSAPCTAARSPRSSAGAGSSGSTSPSRCWRQSPSCFALPRDADGPARRRGSGSTCVGGLLLAAGLGLLVVGLYNPDPQRAVLPSWGPATLAAAAGVLLAVRAVGVARPDASCSTRPACRWCRSCAGARRQLLRRRRADGDARRRPADRADAARQGRVRRHAAALPLPRRAAGRRRARRRAGRAGSASAGSRSSGCSSPRPGTC